MGLRRIPGSPAAMLCCRTVPVLFRLLGCPSTSFRSFGKHTRPQTSCEALLSVAAAPGSTPLPPSLAPPACGVHRHGGEAGTASGVCRPRAGGWASSKLPQVIRPLRGPLPPPQGPVQVPGQHFLKHEVTAAVQARAAAVLGGADDAAATGVCNLRQARRRSRCSAVGASCSCRPVWFGGLHGCLCTNWLRASEVLDLDREPPPGTLRPLGPGCSPSCATSSSKCSSAAHPAATIRCAHWWWNGVGSGAAPAHLSCSSLERERRGAGAADQPPTGCCCWLTPAVSLLPSCSG